MSHHYSGPNIGFPRGDARLDLTDLYAFPKPREPNKSNAGIFLLKPFTEYTADDFCVLVSINLAGFINVTQLAIKQMQAQRDRRQHCEHQRRPRR